MKAEIKLFDYSLKCQKKNIPKVEAKVSYTTNDDEFKDQVDKLMKINNITETMPFDILREYIGKFPYVYIDHVLKFSSRPEDHMEGLRTIHNANIKISDENSHFFQDSVEYLGHIIKHNGITADPKKIEIIKNYPQTKNLRELRSFLGLISYYSKFIKGFSKITEPLTIYLRRGLGMIKKN